MYKLIDTLKHYEIWLLRMAISFPMLWAGVRALINPQDWIGFVPPLPVGNFVTRAFFLAGHSWLMIIFAILIMTGPWRRWAALFAFVNLGVILIFFGVDDITFRDLGLALVALVLLLREFDRGHLSSAG